MTLGNRISCALAIAAAVGATLLTFLFPITEHMVVSSAILMALLVVGTMLLTRWATLPVLRMAETWGSPSVKTADDALAAIDSAHTRMAARLAQYEQDMEGQVRERLSGLIDSNRAVALLLDVVTQDRPDLAVHDHMAHCASRWVSEQLVDGAAILRPTDSTPQLLATTTGQSREYPPQALVDPSTHPPFTYYENATASHWVAIAAYAAGPASETGSTEVRLFLRWSEENAPSPATLASLDAIRHYFDVRANVSGVAPQDHVATGVLNQMGDRLDTTVQAVLNLTNLLQEHLGRTGADQAKTERVISPYLLQIRANMERLHTQADQMHQIARTTPHQ